MRAGSLKVRRNLESILDQNSSDNIYFLYAGLT